MSLTRINPNLIDNNKTKEYIINGSAEKDTTGWATYSDAGTRPVDGTGGSPTITFIRSTGSPLSGSASFLFTKDAANRQGQGASYDFTIDAADKAKVLKIEMDYIVSSGTFVAGSSSTDSDVIAYIYDVTNAVLIEPSSFKFLASSTTISDKFSATFQSAYNSTSYRLILHCASTSASAYVLKFDNISVSPSKYVYGTPITDWQSYTLNITGSTSNPTKGSATNDNATWRRVGDSMEINYQFYVSSAGGAGSGDYYFSIPSGYTIDSSKMVFNSDANQSICGPASGYSSLGSAGSLEGHVFAITPTNLGLALGDEASAPIKVGSSTFGLTAAATVTYNFSASVPILGWSSSVQMSDDYSSRIVTARYGASTSTVTNTSSTVIKYSTKAIDDLNGYDTSTGLYTVKTAGKYKINARYFISVTPTNYSYATISVYINGSPIVNGYAVNHVTGASISLAPEVSAIFDLKAGDTIGIYGDNQCAAGTYSVNNNSAVSYFSLERISGPTTISASEKIAARYTTGGAAQAITTGTATVVQYTVKTFDTHGAFSTSTYRFTAPTSGIYRVTGVFGFTSGGGWNVGEYCSLMTYKNGVKYADIAVNSAESTTTAYYFGSGSDLVQMVAEDYLEFKVYQNSGGTINLNANADNNWIAIDKL